MCHNPSSVDPSTGNTLDFKVMFHKIHMGVNLPSVVAGGSYKIYGFMISVNDYSAIVFPTNDLRTCHICHNESDKTIPDTVNWRTVPSVESCGSCHDNVNFATGPTTAPTSSLATLSAAPVMARPRTSKRCSAGRRRSRDSRAAVSEELYLQHCQDN